MAMTGTYKDTEKITIDAVTQYYMGDATLLHTYIHPQTVLLSVGKGQIIVGADAIRQNLANRNNSGIRYDIESIMCKSYLLATGCCYTMLDSALLVCYPNQMLERVNQRITVIWKYIKEKDLQKEGVAKEGWYGLHLHISIGLETKEAPIDASHLSINKLEELMNYAQTAERVALRDIKQSVHYISRSKIVRFEAVAHQTVAYLSDGQTITMFRRLKHLEQDLGEGFVRTHRHHLVNARYVEVARNYKLFLTDGTILPIPRESFRKIKQLLIQQAVKIDLE
jgi:hypothetical protein